MNQEFISVAEQDGKVDGKCWRSSDGGCSPLCCSAEERGHGALLVFVCVSLSLCLLCRQQSLELAPVGLHIPLAVLCLLPELCFDKWIHSLPAQLGSLSRSPRCSLQSRACQAGAGHPRHCHPALGTPGSTWRGDGEMERGLQ